MPRKTSYFSFAKLNPSDDDEHRVDKFCKQTQSYCAYYIDEINDNLYLMEGFIVFSKKITIYEASDILQDFTVTYLDDIHTMTDHIMNQTIVRTVNKHPALSVKCNLITFFDNETVPADDSSAW